MSSQSGPYSASLGLFENSSASSSGYMRLNCFLGSNFMCGPRGLHCLCVEGCSIDVTNSVWQRRDKEAIGNTLAVVVVVVEHGWPDLQQWHTMTSGGVLWLFCYQGPCCKTGPVLWFFRCLPPVTQHQKNFILPFVGEGGAIASHLSDSIALLAHCRNSLPEHPCLLFELPLLDLQRNSKIAVTWF